MSSKPHRQQDALRASFLALSEACPFDHCNPDDCPLFPVRKMKPKQRRRWLDGLEEDGLSYLAAYHHVCLSVKLGSPLAAPVCGP